MEESDKEKIIALVLCITLGVWGGHRFYVGKVGTGILQMFTFGGLGIWALIDFFSILSGGFTDSEGRYLRNTF